MFPKHHKQTLQGAAVAAGSLSLLPTAWEVDVEGSTAAGHRFPSPSSDLCVLKCQGAGSAQVRGCSRVSAPCRAPKPGEGSDKAAFIPLRATLTHSAPALKELLSQGGEGWGDGDGGKHIRSPCPAFPKEPLMLPGLPMQRDYRNVSELQVSFLFPQKKTGRHSH